MKVFCLLLSVLFLSPVKSQWFFATQYTINPFTPFIQPAFQQSIAPSPPQPQPVLYNNNNNNPAAQRSTGEYRGFSYQTNYDGASSSVFFVTGPEADQLRNSINFPEFRSKEKVATENRARNLASNIEDANAVPHPSSLIQRLLNPNEFKLLFDEQPNGVVHFYSYPADTVPLPETRQSLPTTTTTTTEASTTTTTTATTTTETPKEDAVGAETFVNARFLINAIDEVDKNFTMPLTTEAVRTTPTTTTEATPVPIETTRSPTNSTPTTSIIPTTEGVKAPSIPTSDPSLTFENTTPSNAETTTTTDEIVTIMNEETTTQL